jgi:uncharacterized protein YfaS (alpha-2-macroglobulin family)
MGAIDLLPAGLEIESALSGDEAKAYPWLRSSSELTMADKRDDRFVASFDIGSEYRWSDPKKPEPQPVFTIAYIARAVTTGTFVMPGGVVEDMYAPGVVARTSMSSVTVKP